MSSRRRFGSVRKLPSGRWQATYARADGVRRTGPNTFRTKTEAQQWLGAVESDQLRGLWVDDALGRQRFKPYAEAWLRDHPRLGPRWRETCERNLRLHLGPLTDLRLTEITSAVVRQWHAAALRGTGGRTSIAQSYRFLRAVMYTAVNDGAIARNPCQVRGAGSDRAKERPTATPSQVAALIEASSPRYRAAVALAAWCGLRRGEVLGLTRDDLNLVAGTVTVQRTRTELLATRTAFDSPPKTDAGYRTVAIPPHVLPLLQEHLAQWAGGERVFIGRDGAPMRGDAVRQAFERARDQVGLPGFRFHDLRHTGQTLAAAAGANLADLMRRLGHASTVAAKRYLHASEARDREIAQALSSLR